MWMQLQSYVSSTSPSAQAATSQGVRSNAVAAGEVKWLNATRRSWQQEQQLVERISNVLTPIFTSHIIYHPWIFSLLLSSSPSFHLHLHIFSKTHVHSFCIFKYFEDEMNEEMNRVHNSSLLLLVLTTLLHVFDDALTAAVQFKER